MTATYKLVQWNAHKRAYDITIAAASLGYLVVFAGVSFIAEPGIDPPILAMRGLGTLAMILLHIILCIGPLARLTPLVAPLLYNRRHLGVSMFLAALLHAAIAVGYYSGFGVRFPIAAALADNHAFGSVSGFPFEVLGFLGLAVLFVMAATSHDFWLVNLTPRVWKTLHMLVYAAYALIVLHVILGPLQSEPSPVYPALMLTGVGIVSGLHLMAALREHRRDLGAAEPRTQWIDVGSIDEIPDSRAKVVCLRDGERIAVFAHEGGISAVSNVCAHQGGPLGEGRIVGGCITCPWHGYQYLPANGQSPPPYTEKIPTYEVRLEGRRILVNPKALPPGTPVEPARPTAGDAL